MMDKLEVGLEWSFGRDALVLRTFDGERQTGKG